MDGKDGWVDGAGRQGRSVTTRSLDDDDGIALVLSRRPEAAAAVPTRGSGSRRGRE